MDAEEYIRCQGLVKWSLKLIASVANWRDIPDLKTGLLWANIQAVKQIMEEETFHSYCLFLTPQDWQLYKKNLIPTRDIFDEELHNAGVYLNLTGEICTCRLLLLVFSYTITNTSVFTTSTPAFILSTLLALAPISFPLSTPFAILSPLSTPAPTTSTLLASPMLSTPTPTLSTSAQTIAILASTMSVIPLTTSSSTLTTSAPTYQRLKVAFVEDDKESDSELSFRS